MYGKVELQYNRARQASRRVTRCWELCMLEPSVILMHDCTQKFVRENGALKRSSKNCNMFFSTPIIPKHQLIVWIGRLQTSSITSPFQPSVEGQNHHRALWDHQWRLRGIEVWISTMTILPLQHVIVCWFWIYRCQICDYSDVWCQCVMWVSEFLWFYGSR